VQALGSGSPDPVFAPRARRLSVDTNVAGEDGLISVVLPQDLVVSILADRLLVRTNFFLFLLVIYFFIQNISCEDFGGLLASLSILCLFMFLSLK